MLSAGFVSLCVGFVVLLLMTAWHAVASSDNKIAEGAAPPFAMTLFIGGAQISLILTILQLFATIDDHEAADTVSNAFKWINGTAAPWQVYDADNNAWVDASADVKAEQMATRETMINDMRKMLVWTMAAKVYIVNFLRNNQEWAGPANELKKQSVPQLVPPSSSTMPTM